MKKNVFLSLLITNFFYIALGSTQEVGTTTSQLIQEKRLRVSFCFGTEEKVSPTQASKSIEEFMARVVHNLPGATVIKSKGYWDSGNGIASEQSWVVSSLIPQTKNVDALIYSIARQYAKDFKQYAVSWDTHIVNYSRFISNNVN